MIEQLQQPLKNVPPIAPANWGKGDPLTARKLNESVEAIRGLIRGLGPPVQVTRSPIVEGGGRIGGLFSVKLVKTGGSAGTQFSDASWIYSAFDLLTNEALETNLVIGSTVIGTVKHHWVRPSAGRMTVANFGIAYYDDQNRLVLSWINEQVEQKACAV